MTPEPALPSPAELARRFGDLLDRCVFDRSGQTPSCAVSGGADSVALAVLAVAAGLRPTLCHVDHGLRPGSADEANVVESLARRLGLPFQSFAIDVGSGPNLEARCRDARFAALPDNVMTGHTADDRAETILLNLMWGAGAAGLSAMKPGGRHPILRLRRSDTVALCAALDLEPFCDPTNNDPAIRRNRVRHELLPLINDISQRDVVPILDRQADLLGDEVALLDSLAAELDATDAKAIASAPKPLARRALRNWLAASLPPDHRPDAATVERALGVARGDAVGTDIGAGWRLQRSAQRLSIVGPGPPDL